MNNWVIPYVDQSIDFWQEIAQRFGKRVREVYFPMPGGLTASGRGKQPGVFLEEFLKNVSLKKCVLVNPVILSEPVQACAAPILDALRQLKDLYAVESVTVTDLTLARLIREALPEMYITASVLMRIATPVQVVMVRDIVDAVTVDSSLVHNLAALKAMRKAYQGEIRLLVNEGCLPGCPYRTQHFYEMGYGVPYPETLCQNLLDEQPWLRMTGAWILPQHLHYYDGIYDTLKLAGRVTLNNPQRYIRVLRAYIQREKLFPNEIGGGPASILSPLDISDEAFETILTCNKNCQICTYCRDYYEHSRMQRSSSV